MCESVCVCEKVVCERVVRERNCVSKLCVSKLCVRELCVCVRELVVRELCERVGLCVMRGRECTTKTKNHTHKDVGNKSLAGVLFWALCSKKTDIFSNPGVP